MLISAYINIGKYFVRRSHAMLSANLKKILESCMIFCEVEIVALEICKTDTS